MNSTSVLIIGGSGIIGSALRGTFRNQLHTATYFSQPFEDGVRFDLENDDFSAICPNEAQISHGLIVTNQGGIDDIARNPEQSWRVNVDGPIRIAEQMLKRGIKPVIFSSDMVFSGHTGGYDENAHPAPVNTYGRHKLALEKAVGGLPGESLILRLAKVITGQLTPQCIVGGCFQAALENRTLQCIDDHYFNPIWIDDAVDIISRLVHQNASGIFHVCGNESTSRFNIAQRVLQRLPIHLKKPELYQSAHIRDFPFEDERPKDISMLNLKVCSVTGKSPMSLDATIDHIIKTWI